MRRLGALLALLALPQGAAALGLDLPAPARQTASVQEKATSLALPVSPWRMGKAQTVRVEGDVSHSVYRLQAADLSTLEMLRPLRAQLEAAGFDIVFECEARECGGFEFRFATAVLGAPQMHVDLGDYHYLMARRTDGDAPPEHVCLMVSRTAGAGYLQVTRVGPEAGSAAVASAKNVAVAEPQAAAGGGPAAPAGPDALSATLAERGRAVLGGLSFETGSADLGAADQPALDALAGWLRAHPEAQVVLVGHTDAEGSLAGNIALSRQRAASVRAWLAETHGIPEARVAAEGIGFLAPRASNATARGRDLNRRVEVVLAE